MESDSVTGDNSILIKMLLESEAVQFGEFTLTSGKKSGYYCDIKKAMTHPDILREIARLVAPFVVSMKGDSRAGGMHGEKEEGIDRIAGMELGAVPLAAAVSLETGRPFLIVRKKDRSHGTGRQIEGEHHPGENVLVVEDVATTGGSVARTVDILRDAGLRVSGAVVVVDREEGAAELLEKNGVALHALVTMTGIMEKRPRGD